MFTKDSIKSDSIQFYNNDKNEVHKERVKIGNVTANSSKEYAAIKCNVPGKLGDKFHVEIEMEDKSGNIVSENKYLLLVADEKVDLPRLREIGQEAIDKKEKYGSHNYLRYFEGLNGARGIKQADEVMPTVKEFDNNKN